MCFLTVSGDRHRWRIVSKNKTNQIKHHDGFTKKDITYKPNENLNLGFGGSYKWLGLDLAFDLPFVNDDDEIFGKRDRALYIVALGSVLAKAFFSLLLI